MNHNLCLQDPFRGMHVVTWNDLYLDIIHLRRKMEELKIKPML